MFLDDRHLAELQGDAMELLARHHGLPSPMLDWTASPYIAAFFAYIGSIDSASEAVAVWALNRTKYALPDSDLKMIGEDDPALLRFNRRALHQRGYFTRISTIRLPVDELLSDAIVKFTIPTQEAKLALTELDAMTINSTYLFADVEAAARTATHRVSLGRM